MIKDISESEDATTEDMTNKSKYSIISKDLEKLINTRTKNDAKVSDEITANEYNDFVDNGIVKAGRITKIAEKVKNGIDLTQQEKEMFQDKTTEINEELRKMSEKDVAKAKPSDIEKELFSETDSKGRINTVFSTTKEKDGLIKTTFTFNRSDKDPSQRNNMITGIPVEKALGNNELI